jgi:hypothetical protein
LEIVLTRQDVGAACLPLFLIAFAAFWVAFFLGCGTWELRYFKIAGGLLALSVLLCCAAALKAEPKRS